MTKRMDRLVAVVTGGARGIGGAAAERLAALGARVVVADVEDGSEVAERIGGRYLRCDVTDLEDVEHMMAATVATYGRLDIVLANAGVRGDSPIGEAFDLTAYRRAMSVNLDGVVFTVQAALRHLLASGGGRVLVTASMAGLMPVAIDVPYAASKAAAVGFVRSAAPILASQGVTLLAVCPSFADTAILGEGRALLESAGFAIMPVDQVADAMLTALDAGAPGECWMVQAGREPEVFRFRNPPGPRNPDGSPMALDQESMNSPGRW
jgi:NAD(P)-dependent dehydrogenase (short-subunit alcohol dehydrogenase family)